MPVDCEIPLGRGDCGIAAVARCTQCERAVCTQHRAWAELCTVCYGESPALHCAFCRAPQTHRCSRCGEAVCKEHMAQTRVPVEVGPGVSLYQHVATGFCTRCRGILEAEKADHRLAMQRAAEGHAPFPPLSSADLGLREGQALPTPGSGHVRFDGLYEKVLGGGPGMPRAHAVRFLPDGRMYSGDYDTIGTPNMRTARMDPADIGRHLVDHAEPVMVEIDGGRVSRGSFLATQVIGWIDTAGSLVLERIDVSAGQRHRTAGIYQFVGVPDLIPLAPMMPPGSAHSSRRGADRAAADVLRRQKSGAAQRDRAIDVAQGTARQRLEADVAGLVRDLLPLLEAHGMDHMKAFRVAAARTGLRSNFRKDRAGWKVASIFRDSSWGGSTVDVFLLTNGEFIDVPANDDPSTFTSGGFTRPLQSFGNRELAKVQDGIQSQLQRYRKDTHE